MSPGRLRPEDGEAGADLTSGRVLIGHQNHHRVLLIHAPAIAAPAIGPDQNAAGLEVGAETTIVYSIAPA